MGYALDTAAQKMVHALCEGVLLRSRLRLPPDRPESVIVRDLLEDLAGALGLYAGLPEDAPGDGYDVVKFVYEIQRCTETWHVGKVLSRSPELARFAFHPYLSMTDMNKLEHWKAGGAEAAKAP